MTSATVAPDNRLSIINPFLLQAHQAAVEDGASGCRGDLTQSPLSTPARLGRPPGLDGDGDRHHHGDGDRGLGRWRRLVTLEEEESKSGLLLYEPDEKHLEHKHLFISNLLHPRS